MQPIGNAWSKLPRLIRDLSHELGKKIDLHMHGQETELDRQVLELIKDPLTHLVRNCADHGLEPPDERKAAGKPETGKVILNAFHEGGHIIIEIKDDGRGLDKQKIAKKAIEKGIATDAELAAMPDQQVAQFIFAAGFSTAAQVTCVSGRGVGMDVVKTNIELIGGQIDLTSTAGKGSVFSIKIPLTLAIVSALVVGAGGERFALPQLSVVELVRAGGDSDTTVENLKGSRVLRLRDRLLPLVDLTALLNLPSRRAVGAASFVVVMQAGGRRFGVEVDEVFDTEEIVVKPLATLLRGVPRLSGATILGDGSVVVILDPNGLAEALGSAQEADAADAAAETTIVSSGGRQSLLLFRAGSGGVKAAPLMLITRLEETDAASIERADGRAVMKYRGALMPVIHAGGDHMFRTEGQQPVLVFSHGDQPFGLAVDEIVDIVHEDVTLDLAADRPGVIGAALVRGRATEMIDVGYYVEQAGADWAQRTRAKKRGRVLLVEGSDFARTMLTPLIQAAGYEIAAAPTPDDAWRLHEAGARFDAILADVDANPAAAASFAEKVAADAVWSGAARIALSGAGGQAPQFDDCVRKTDRSQLLAALDYAVTAKRSWGNAA